MPFQKTPMYDPQKTYEENCKNGPFGGFTNETSYQNAGEPKHTFLGHKIYLPFGIPAGPLPTAKFIIGAFKNGFDLPVYKTVRTQEQKCHPWPNVVPVKVEGDLTMEKANNGLITDDDYHEPIAITNSFGVPSWSPELWQPDMTKAVKAAGPGQVMIASFQGTNRGEGIEAFVKDHQLGARLVMETGAKIIELNLSCPNEGKKELLCHDTDTVEKIAASIKEVIGNTPLLLKISYFEDNNKLLDFIKRLSGIVQGFSTINTIASSIRKPNGEQALPGEGRLRSGVCGAPIKWAGIEMVKRIKKMKDELNKNFVIIGVGGVTKPQDYFEYIKEGADAVMSATGAMWNTNLAQEIKAYK
jgi:dihydroorotate dehydrogenase (NAD+) catalytic subunit